MKKGLLYFLSIIFLAGCDGAVNECCADSKGVIMKVQKFDDGTVIWVSFKGYKDATTTIKFNASDTCKVGQIVTLK